MYQIVQGREGVPTCTTKWIDMSGDDVKHNMNNNKKNNHYILVLCNAAIALCRLVSIQLQNKDTKKAGIIPLF